MNFNLSLNFFNNQANHSSAFENCIELPQLVSMPTLFHKLLSPGKGPHILEEYIATTMDFERS